MSGKTLIGVDVGGTFTDLILFDGATGRLETVKTPSRRGDEALGFLAGLEKRAGRQLRPGKRGPKPQAVKETD